MKKTLKQPHSYRAYPQTHKQLRYICKQLKKNESDTISGLISNEYDAIKASKEGAKTK